MAKKSIIAVVSVAALILPLSAFAQGSAGTGSTSTGIGAPAGPAGPGIRSNGWTQQPGVATNTTTTGSANLSPSQKNSIPPTNEERAGLSEIVACWNVRALRISSGWWKGARIDGRLFAV
jgi:hypothetical protein